MMQRLLCTAILLIVTSQGWTQVRPLGKVQKTPSIEIAIKNELETTLEKYRPEASNETTWKQMRQDADAILFRYFQKGKLLGNTKSQAYFYKIGPETMTATDIKNNKKILLVGIAIQKPAEFVMIRIEK